MTHHTGGVFAQVKKPFNLYCVKPNTKAAQRLLASGRFGMYGGELGTNAHVLCFNLYGWTNGRGNQHARERTNDMIKIVMEEAATHPNMPMIICGDLNCSREELPHAEKLVDSHWTDLGASADMWGGTPYEKTCFVTETSVGTRNDYSFVHPPMLPYIRTFLCHTRCKCSNTSCLTSPHRT